jgi:hypothetical protein
MTTRKRQERHKDDYKKDDMREYDKYKEKLDKRPEFV